MYEVELNIGGSARVIELPEDSDKQDSSHPLKLLKQCFIATNQ